jgi:hypothetical protein
MGTPKTRALDPVSGFHCESQYFGVELHGSIQLVRDDFYMVDPLEHHYLTLSRRDPSLPVAATRLLSAS